MRMIQFWTLVLLSSLVSFVLIYQIVLTRSLLQKERELAEVQQVASSGGAYERAWKEFAMQIYEAGKQDPELAAILKTENVTIHATQSPAPASSSGAATPPTAASFSKEPTGTTH